MSDYAAQFSLLASVFPPADIHVVDGERMVIQPLEEIRWIEETNDIKSSNPVPFQAGWEVSGSEPVLLRISLHLPGPRPQVPLLHRAGRQDAVHAGGQGGVEGDVAAASRRHAGTAAPEPGGRHAGQPQAGVHAKAGDILPANRSQTRDMNEEWFQLNVEGSELARFPSLSLLLKSFQSLYSGKIVTNSANHFNTPTKQLAGILMTNFINKDRERAKW